MDGSLWQGWDPSSLRQPGAHAPHPDKGVYTADGAMLGLSFASTTQPDLLAPWGGSMATGTLGSLGSFSVASSAQPYRSVTSADLDGFDGITTQQSKLGMDSSNLTDYPRIITAARLLADSDDESTWCGPPSEPGESAASEKRSMEAWGIGNAEDERQAETRPNNSNRNRRDREGGGAALVAAAAAAAASASSTPMRGGEAPRERPQREPREPRQERPRREPREPGEAQSRRPPPLIQPRGDVDGDNQKFICVFQIGLEDNEEFCLVKRILGKAGNNMRRIAEECSAKVRLRGIGSGFLEGADGKEANMPLQLNVSCTDFDSYQGSVDRVSTLLKDLYKHYRRYARSKGSEPPDVKVSLEEVRRDDIGLDLLQQKAQRSPSQRERDRRAREKERQQQREKEKDKERDRAEREPLPPPPPPRSAPRQRSRERRPPEQYDEEEDLDDDLNRGTPTLPGGAPIPTTPAGRRLAARAGGAEHAAIVSAAARDAEKVEREKVRKEKEDQREKEKDDREKKKREAAERAAAIANRTRGGARTAVAKPSPGAVGGAVASDKASSAPKEQSTSFPAKPVETSEGQWTTWKGSSWDSWDPWASAAAKKSDDGTSDSKGKGKSSQEGKGSGKKKSI